jgi:predicted DCC family thiol-disulfide oxidoreductase YuxK
LTTAADQPILFFDGVCNLCNRAVQFILKYDKKKIFVFASLQSEPGKKAIAAAATAKGTSRDSVVLFYKGRYYQRSSAALKTLQLLGFPWSLTKLFYILPSAVRDSVYDFVARNRYKWFGRKEECMVPSPDLASRFLS